MNECSVEGCAAPAACRGLCDKHYRRVLHHGDALHVGMRGAGPVPAVGRFWDKVDKNGPVPAHVPELGPCWVWTAGRFATTGYGAFNADGRTTSAHRFSLEMALGRRLLPDEFACHRCDNRLCCRGSHLFVGTTLENAQDMVAKGRSARGDRNGCRRHPEAIARGEAAGNAKLTEAQVIEIRARRASGEQLGSLAAAFGIGKVQVSRIAHRTRWAHVPEGAPR